MKYGFIKVASAVPFVKVANCDYNIERIEKMIFKAEEQGVEIIVFPELSITGYTCADLFLQPYLLRKAEEALSTLVARTAETQVMVIVGTPVRADEKLFNSAVVFQHGQILGAIPKTYLPNYREFQEKRWFSPASDLQYSLANIAGHKVPIGHNIIFRSGRVGIGIEICEDMWTPYTPGTRLCLYGAEIIFNLSASNENAGKHTYLRSLISGLSSQNISGYVYASCGYGESSTDVVFTGKGFIVECGEIVEEMERFDFSERMIVSDIDVSRIQTERLINSSFRAAVSLHTDTNLIEIPFTLRSEEETKPMVRAIDRNPFLPDTKERDERCQEIFNIQISGLAQRLRHMNSKHVVLGISGGLDSTHALLVAVSAFDFLNLDRKGIVAVTMPGFGTSGRTHDNALNLMDALGVTMHEIDITEACMLHFEQIGHDPNVHDAVYENAQARERTQILMDMANKYNGPVIGTGDLSELALGWCTFNGDQMAMYSVNAGLPKTSIQIIDEYLAKVNYFGVEVSKTLRAVLNTPISPELKPLGEGEEVSQSTETILGPYELHDFFAYHFLHNSFSPEKIFFLARVAFGQQYANAEIKRCMQIFFRRFFSQQFKRNAMPDGPKVSRISLSPRGEWRMVSDAHADLWLKAVDELPD